MKKFLLLALSASILASCGNNVPTSYDLTGKVTGTAPGQPVKLVMVGASVAGVGQADIPQISIQLGNTGFFGVDFPNNPRTGGYDVFAYVDGNGNGKYEIGEQRTTPNGKFLVYAETNNIIGDLLGIKKGWNLIQGLQASQPGRINEYNLSW